MAPRTRGDRQELSAETEVLELEAELAARRWDLQKGLVPPGVTRSLFEHELQARTNFASIDSALTAGKAKLEGTLKQARAAYLESLLADLEGRSPEAIVRRLLELDGSAGWTDVAGAKELLEGTTELLLDELATVADSGAVLLRAEAAAQGAPLGPDPELPPATLSRLEVLAIRIASGPQVDLVRALREEAVKAGRATELAEPGDLLGSIAEAGAGLSDRSLADYASSSANAAHGLGRQVGVESVEAEPARIYASELLDGNTCPACWGIDGTEYESIAESLEDYPEGGYVNCDGGLRCRGSRVFVWDEAPATRRTPPGEAPEPPPRGFEPPPRGPRPTRPGGPATPPAPTPAAPARAGQDPAAGFDLSGLTKAQRAVADEALADVGAVHNVELPSFELPVKASNARTRLGSYEYWVNGPPDAIRIVFGKGNPHPRLTLAHEIGHYLDHFLIGARGTHLTGQSAALSGDGLLAKWWEAIKGSDAAKALARAERTGLLESGAKVQRTFLRYLMRTDELFARSYAQYVATRTTSATIKAELADHLGQEAGRYARQWTDDDFEPIARAFDELFEKLGWKVPE